MEEIEKYANQKKELYDLLITFIEEEEESNENFQDLINFIQTEKIAEIQEDFRELIELIYKITKNYCFTPQFISKIAQIFNQYKTYIKKYFSDREIFDLFKKSKRILLLLFKEQILTLDDSIIDYIKSKCDTNETKYSHYFYPEIKSSIPENLKTMIENELQEINPTILDNFEENRQIGENDSYICQLIRQDDVQEFISYITRKNISTSQKVPPSLFETNPFLINNQPTLIEYAAFHGSIQIFQFLQFSNVELTKSLLNYSIHGQNSDIIHLIENSKNIIFGLLESIKCHHNNIANYFIDAYLVNKNLEKIKNFVDTAFHYYNYSFLPKNLAKSNLFLYICKYNYVKLLDLFMKAKIVNIQLIMSNTKIFFSIVF